MRSVRQIIFLLLVFPAVGAAQDSILFKGQLSGWLLGNFDNDLPVHAGIRYIPQINNKISLKEDKTFDLEASLNLNGSLGLHPFDSLTSEGTIKPYRLWVRYSTRQLEIRAGLQKINFGSASLLRPLMWFDQVDTRDPLKLTDGVWGVLGRYYFLNNANIWLWGLYGNTKPKGWEISGTNNNYPEAGCRIQVPVPRGEAGFTYHFRVSDTRDTKYLIPLYESVPENRVGFDIKLDLSVGLWLEGSWAHSNKSLENFTNQEILNAGIDYTFGLGNGLYVIYEQMVFSYDQKAFDFQNNTTFSLLSLSYPVGLFDNISGIIYYDWKNGNAYNFISWQKQFNNLTLYMMGFWNPENYKMPAYDSKQNYFAGKGVQIMVVVNH